MSGFSKIDLGKLAAPQVIEVLDPEQIITEMKADLVLRLPEIADTIDLESELALKIIEVCAYREVILRARVNDGAKAVMLPLTTGTDLDNIAALFGVERLVVQAENLEVDPAQPLVMEDDATFRNRVSLSLEAHTTAGTVGSYLYWALSADGSVKDASVFSAIAGEVEVSILSHVGDGTPDAGLLSTVESQLNDDYVRPLTDLLTVSPAAVSTYQIEAVLTLYFGPDDGVVLAAANAAVTQYVADHHRLGHDITRSGILAALHQSGVQNVALTAPAADLVTVHNAARYCDAITLSIGGRDV